MTAVFSSSSSLEEETPRCRGPAPTLGELSHLASSRAPSFFLRGRFVSPPFSFSSPFFGVLHMTPDEGQKGATFFENLAEIIVDGSGFSKTCRYLSCRKMIAHRKETHFFWITWRFNLFTDFDCMLSRWCRGGGWAKQKGSRVAANKLSFIVHFVSYKNSWPFVLMYAWSIVLMGQTQTGRRGDFANFVHFPRLLRFLFVLPHRNKNMGIRYVYTDLRMNKWIKRLLLFF